MSLPRFVPFVLAFACLGAACSRPTSNGEAPVAPAACAKEGQPCTFAEGKLGMCTVQGDLDGGPGFMCMSLH